MFKSNATQSDPGRAPPRDLKAACAAATSFPTDHAKRLVFSMEALTKFANEETSFGRIVVDDRGLTTGTRLHILEPARQVVVEWREARRPFDVALHPAMADIRAADKAKAEIVEREQRRDRDKGNVEALLEAEKRYLQVKERFHEAEDRFKAMRAEHGNRDANLGAYSVLYWVGLLCIGIAEWLINYDVFLLFVGVQAIAAGATIVMGVLLAFAAHGHGQLLKQWTFRFGQHRDRRDRFADWRLLLLSTFSLLVVLAAATGSRYAAVMHQMVGSPQGNILPDVGIDINPMRDVLLSLLWNVMAWAVGVFIAYMGHDADAAFMDATRQYHDASREYHRRRAPMEDSLRTIEAKFVRDIAAAEATAQTRLRRIEPERKLLDQVDAHETALVNHLTALVRSAAQAYHNVIAQIAISQGSAMTIERQGGSPAPLTAYEFRTLTVNIDAQLIRELAS